MPIPIITGRDFYYKRMIKCPGHYLISPKVDIYLREPEPLLKNCSDQVEYKGKMVKIKKMRIVRDRWGNKMVDWKKLHGLLKTGEVINPPISAAEAIERIWDPTSYLCKLCSGKYCREGQGTIVESTIGRLSGRPMKR